MSVGKGRGDPAGIADILFNQHFGTLISAVGTAALAIKASIRSNRVRWARSTVYFVILFVSY